MRILSNGLKWIVDNASNLLSAIGIFLTLYFGIFYVPSWLKEYQDAKINSALFDIQQSVKEIAYSDSTISISEIEALIKAKEIGLKQSLPYRTEEILTLSQESFMDDKFLPLSKRRTLIAKLELLKKDFSSQATPVDTQTQKAKLEISYLPEIASTLLTLIFVSLGLFSSYFKFRKDKAKDEEIENSINQVEVETLNNTPLAENYKNYRDTAMEYEKSLGEEIGKYPGVEIIAGDSRIDAGYDLAFVHDGKTYYVEFKWFSKNKIGINTIERFLLEMRNKEGEGWFISNLPLTNLAEERIARFNSRFSKKKLRSVLITDAIDLRAFMNTTLK